MHSLPVRVSAATTPHRQRATVSLVGLPIKFSVLTVGGDRVSERGLKTLQCPLLPPCLRLSDYGFYFLLVSWKIRNKAAKYCTDSFVHSSQPVVSIWCYRSLSATGAFQLLHCFAADQHILQLSQSVWDRWRTFMEPAKPVPLTKLVLSLQVLLIVFHQA